MPVFAGRSAELGTLSRVLSSPGGTAVITAIGGTAGVGKKVAVDAGHRYETARARVGLGAAHDALGHRGEAVFYWRLAHDAFAWGCPRPKTSAACSIRKVF
jgi:hypothetical protein